MNGTLATIAHRYGLMGGGIRSGPGREAPSYGLEEVCEEVSEELFGEDPDSDEDGDPGKHGDGGFHLPTLPKWVVPASVALGGAAAGLELVHLARKHKARKEAEGGESFGINLEQGAYSRSLDSLDGLTSSLRTSTARDGRGIELSDAGYQQALSSLDQGASLLRSSIVSDKRTKDRRTQDSRTIDARSWPTQMAIPSQFPQPTQSLGFPAPPTVQSYFQGDDGSSSPVIGRGQDRSLIPALQFDDGAEGSTPDSYGAAPSFSDAAFRVAKEFFGDVPFGVIVDGGGQPVGSYLDVGFSISAIDAKKELGAIQSLLDECFAGLAVGYLAYSGHSIVVLLPKASFGASPLVARSAVRYGRYGADLQSQIADIESQVIGIAKKYISMFNIPKMISLNKQRDALIDQGQSSNGPGPVAIEKQGLGLLSGITQPVAAQLWAYARQRDNLRRQVAGHPAEPIGAPPQLV